MSPNLQHYNEQIGAQAYLLHPKLVAQLPDCATLRCIELGAGEGNVLLDVAAARPGWNFTAVDNDAPVLEVLGSRMRADTLAQSILEPLPFEDSAFDVAIIVSTILYFDQAQLSGLLKEVARILKPGGVLVAADPHPEWQERKLSAPLEAGQAVAEITDSWQGKVSSKWWRSVDEYRRAIEAAGFVPELTEIRIPDEPSLPERYRERTGSKLYLVARGVKQ